MNINFSSNVFLYFIIILIAISIILIGLYCAAREHLKKSRISREKDIIDIFLDDRAARLKRMDSPLSVSVYCAILLVCPPAMMIIGMFLTQNLVIACVFAIFGLTVPDMIVRGISQVMNKKFEERYAQSLEQLGSSLSAGLSLQQAVIDVVNCQFIHPSIKKHYMKLSADLQVGVPVSDAFRTFAENINSQDAMDVALAIDVQNEVGGKEAEVVLDIAANIKERIMLRKEVNSIFANSSSMVLVMDFMPISVILISMLMNPSYTDVYFSSPLYVCVFALCIMLPLIGSLVNHKTLKKVRRDA